MRHRVIGFVGLVFLLAPIVHAQGTLGRGSPERAAALDALRSRLQSDPHLRGSLEFHDVTIRTANDWAHVAADPRRPGGRATRHCEQSEPEEPGGSQVDALLQRTGGRWTVIEWGSCATDVWYEPWTFRFGLPAPLQISGPVEYPYSASVLAADGFLALRSEASAARGERLAQIPTDTTVEVASCRPEVEAVDGVYGRWCQATYDGRQGWVFTGYLF